LVAGRDLSNPGCYSPTRSSWALQSACLRHSVAAVERLDFAGRLDGLHVS